MFRRQLANRPNSHLCQICEFSTTRRLHVAKSPLVTLSAGTRRTKVFQEISRDRGPHVSARNITTAQGKTTRGPREQSPPRKQLPNLDKLVASVRQVTKVFLSQGGIPSEATTAAALGACASAANVLMDANVQPQLSSMEHQSDTAASNLLSLDANGRKVTEAPPPRDQSVAMTRLRDVIDKISAAAYSIIVQPTVFITPQLLGQYVDIQARLGKPETLPHVFLLYVSKPLPRLSAGSIEYMEPNPHKASNAIDVKVAEMALDAAVEAKNIDAAVGIIENSYAAKAFIRAKMMTRGFLPASVFVLFPVAAYGLASNLALLQDSMDDSTATSITFAGILAYVGFTATIGIVATTTANDQMRRVTWAPGTPLRQRWIREEERAAFDKIACSFGFSESHRYGEEEGDQFQSLREYILRKGMILDQVELMEGMGG